MCAFLRADEFVMAAEERHRSLRSLSGRTNGPPPRHALLEAFEQSFKKESEDGGGESEEEGGDEMTDDCIVEQLLTPNLHGRTNVPWLSYDMQALCIGLLASRLCW